MPQDQIISDNELGFYTALFDSPFGAATTEDHHGNVVCVRESQDEPGYDLTIAHGAMPPHYRAHHATSMLAWADAATLAPLYSWAPEES